MSGCTPTYVQVHTHLCIEAKGVARVLHLIPFRQTLSLSLRHLCSLIRQIASQQDAYVSPPPSARAIGMHRLHKAFI